MSFWRWKKVASENSNADPSINWVEGQLPSTVNDSARAMMAALAKYRDDVDVGVITTGDAWNYSAASNQGFASNASGNTLSIIPHVANSPDGVTLSVDGLPALPLRAQAGQALPPYVLLAGTPYRVTCTGTEWRVHGLPGQQYSDLVGCIFTYAGITAPPYFAFAVGQEVNRTWYPLLYSRIGDRYGAGNGTTTFNLPDLRDRFELTAVNLGDAGTKGGAWNVSIQQSHLPAVSLGVSGSANVNVNVGVNVNVSVSGYTDWVGDHAHYFTARDYSSQVLVQGGTTYNAAYPANAAYWTSNSGAHQHYISALYGSGSGSGSGTGSGSISGSTTNLGSGTALPIVPPYIRVNKIIRLI